MSTKISRICARLASVILGLSLLFHTSLALSQNETENEARREFLFNLGFEDVPKIIREKLEKREYTHELNRRQMEANAIAYEVLNASRELSIAMLSEVTSPESLAQFATKMLALKPLSPSIDYPTEIINMPEGESRDGALVEWLHKERVSQMNAHKAKILSDIVHLLYGQSIEGRRNEIRRLDKMLNTIVERMYMDDTIGNGKYFGRALTALLLREEKLRGHAGQNEKQITKFMSEELKTRHNLRLENFIGDTLVLQTPKGDERFTVENGTMMLSRNLSAGSLQISISAIPKNLLTRWKARFGGLIGTPLIAPFLVKPEQATDGISLGMRIRDRIAQGGILRSGFSHIVYYEVKEDPKTGIKMARVIDNYPNRVFDATGEYVRTGGTRLTYPEQVIDLSHHAAAYFANPVADKVQEWSQKSRSEIGYQKEFFPSTELQLDGTIPVKSSKIVNWKTTVSESEYNDIHNESNPNKLKQDVFKRFTSGLTQTVYEGWTFHWPDPYDFYLISATYCSQLAEMVMKKYVGMGIEQTKSVWHWGVRFLANIGKLGEQLRQTPGLQKVGESLMNLPGVEKASKISKIEIISPTNLALQPYMKGKFFGFESRTPEQKIQSSYMIGDYREADPTLTKKLQRETGLTEYSMKTKNFVLDYGAAMRDFEYGLVMRASQGFKTKGFSAEVMAHLGSKKEAPRSNQGLSCRRVYQ